MNKVQIKPTPTDQAHQQAFAEKVLQSEAQAIGRIAIGADFHDAVELILRRTSDGKTGSVVPPCDARALAEAVTRLLREPERAAALGAEARKRARKDFHRPVQAGRMVAFYLELLSRIDRGSPS